MYKLSFRYCVMTWQLLSRNRLRCRLGFSNQLSVLKYNMNAKGKPLVYFNMEQDHGDYTFYCFAFEMGP